MAGAVAAGTAAKNSGSAVTYGGNVSSVGSSPTPIGRQYFATRKSENVYDLAGGPLVTTRFCYVFAYSSPAMVAGSKILFLNMNQSCDIDQIFNR